MIRFVLCFSDFLFNSDVENIFGDGDVFGIKIRGSCCLPNSGGNWLKFIAEVDDFEDQTELKRMTWKENQQTNATTVRYNQKIFFRNWLRGNMTEEGCVT